MSRRHPRIEKICKEPLTRDSDESAWTDQHQPPSTGSSAFRVFVGHG